MRFGKMPSSCLCFCKASVERKLLAGFLAGLAWLLASFLAGFLAGLAWLGFWLAFWLVWLGFWLVWFGSAGLVWLLAGFLAGLVWLLAGFLAGLVWLLAGFLAGFWLVWLGFLFFLVFSSPCRNAAAGRFASVSRGHYFAATRLHAAF